MSVRLCAAWMGAVGNDKPVTWLARDCVTYVPGDIPNNAYDVQVIQAHVRCRFSDVYDVSLR